MDKFLQKIKSENDINTSNNIKFFENLNLDDDRIYKLDMDGHIIDDLG